MIEGTPEPFDHLPDQVKTIWRAYATVYEITVGDTPLFEQFCDSYARWQELIRKANESAPMVTIKGDVVTNPHLARADKEAANWKHALAMLQRLKKGSSPDAEETEADEFDAIKRAITARLAEFSQDAQGLEGDRKQAGIGVTKTPRVQARRLRAKKTTIDQEPTG